MTWMNRLLTAMILIFLFSCGGDDEMPCDTPESFSTLRINFHPKWNGEDVQAGSEFEDQFGNRLRLFNFKSYVSNLHLTGESEQVDLSEVEILDFNEGTATLEYSFPNNSDYDELNFSTGVPAEYNVDYDPSTWPNSHPLSIQGAQGMHWEWNTGYKFTIFDGKADTTDAVEPFYIYPFTFHAGDDAFYTDHEFSIDLTSEVETEHTLDITIHMEKFLAEVHTIDIRVDGETHTGGDFDLAQQFVDNFNLSFSLE